MSFLRRGNLPVLNISLDGELLVSNLVARDCYNQSGILVNDISQLSLSKFSISYTRNKFTAVGCDTYVIFNGLSREENYTTGCLSLCDHIDSVVNGSCSGIGCCQTSIPEGVTSFAVGLGSFNNHSTVLDFNPCGFGFVGEEDAYNFSSLDLKFLQNRTSVPLVLDWVVGNETCQDAKSNSTSYACKAEYSECYNSNNGPGYRCNCYLGFQGNHTSLMVVKVPI